MLNNVSRVPISYLVPFIIIERLPASAKERSASQGKYNMKDSQGEKLLGLRQIYMYMYIKCISACSVNDKFLVLLNR